ncbi:MAG: CoA ester lyase [Acidobacteriota bacterium]
MARPPIARSYLFAPGDNAHLLVKVRSAGADAVVLDLEGGVAPERKEEAREAVREIVEERSRHLTGDARADGAHLAAPQPAIWVRINTLSSTFWRDDVAAIVHPGLAGVRVPRAEDTRLLDELDATLRRLESKRGLPTGSTRVACTVESALGVLHAPRIAEHRRTFHLCFGAGDFAADIGADPTDPMATLYAESTLVISSRAAGIEAPIGPAWTHLDDFEGFARSTARLRHLGFFGRSAIHPSQLDTIHEAFTPTAEDVVQARGILATLDANAERHSDRHFVDEAIARRARRVLELAGQLELDL